MIHQSSYGFALVLTPHDFRSEIYINRLGTTTQIFKPMDYWILMSEKYRYFGKRQKHVARKFFSHPIEVTVSMYLGNIFRIVCISLRIK